MKLFPYITSALAALCLLVSCQSKLEENRLYEESDFVAPVLVSPESINLTEATLANEDAKVTFTWKKADFGQPAEILYNLNASYNGKAVVLLAGLSGESREVGAAELGDKLINLGIPHGQTVNVTFSIDCSFGTDFISLKSADKSVSVYVY